MHHRRCSPAGTCHARRHVVRRAVAPRVAPRRGGRRSRRLGGRRLRRSGGRRRSSKRLGPGRSGPRGSRSTEHRRGPSAVPPRAAPRRPSLARSVHPADRGPHPPRRGDGGSRGTAVDRDRPPGCADLVPTRGHRRGHGPRHGSALRRGVPQPGRQAVDGAGAGPGDHRPSRRGRRPTRRRTSGCRRGGVIRRR